MTKEPGNLLAALISAISTLLAALTSRLLVGSFRRARGEIGAVSCQISETFPAACQDGGEVFEFLLRDYWFSSHRSTDQPCIT